MSTRILALASGTGTNLRAVVRAIQEMELQNCHIVQVVTDRTGSGAAHFARQNDVKVLEIPFHDYPDNAAFQSALLKQVQAARPDLILALGFMRLLNREFVDTYMDKIINIHPSILPAFPGMHAQRQAYEYGARVSGCTVHFVDHGTDTGPIILQRAVDISAARSAEEVRARILTEEHRAIVEAVQLFVDGALSRNPANPRHIIIEKS